MSAGSAIGLAGGFGDMISGIIGSQLAPGVPKGTGIVDQAMSTQYGVNPNQTQQLKDLQSKLASATTDASKAKIQKQIDSLQTAIAKTSSQGYTGNFLSNLGSELPQLQGL